MLPELNGSEHSERVQTERQLIDKALLTCAELLEAENKRLDHYKKEEKHFHIDDINMTS